MLDQSMIAAWRVAAADLKIRVVAPFQLKIGDRDGGRIEGYLPDFGGPTGIVFSSSRRRRVDVGKHTWSELGEDYQTYRRQFFIDTLNDWGYFGKEGLAPDWFTGQPWS